MDAKKVGIGLLFIIGLFITAVAATAVPVDIVEVEVDGTEVVSVLDGGINRLSLERGQSFSVRVEMEGTGYGDDIEVEVFISGYEHSDIDPISDREGPFDIEDNLTRVERFTLRLPSLVDEDDYRLRVIVSDRNGDVLIQDYRLKIDVQRHDIEIRDVVFTPGGSVEQGSALLVSVRLKNTGDKDEDSAKVTVSIPALGISAADFIDEIEKDESKSSEELFLRIPSCSNPGVYDVDIEVTFNDGFDRVTASESISVLPSGACPAQPSGKTTISFSAEAQNVRAGGSTSFAITISNNEGRSRTFTLEVSGVDFGSASVSPGNTVTVGDGETKTVWVQVDANRDATSGDHDFDVAVKDATGNTLKQLQLTAKVDGGAAPGAQALDFGNLRRVLEIALVVLVVLLVIIALIVAFSRLRGGGEEGEEGSQTYY